jgi:two-component system CheB/CheR fusion protein
MELALPGDQAPHEGEHAQSSEQLNADNPPADPEPRAVLESGDDSPARKSWIVGVGASAGGLEALEAFFTHVPSDSGLAYVVIQHLSPDFKSLMDELLARHAKIPIHRVEDGMAVEPNAVYLLPPRKEMIISGGHLLLSDKDPSQTLSLPIDTFFRSLAQDAGDRAIGVILSGTGSDGSRGVRAIHEAGGLVLVQKADTAHFDGMPRSAIDTGVVDLILPPPAMPAALVRYVQMGVTSAGDGSDSVAEDELTTIFSLLHREHGLDFTCYKPSTVHRRIERRIVLGHSEDLARYLERLQSDPAELNALYHDLLIGVTRFFRDSAAFELLEQRVIPELLERLDAGQELRAWAPGCATGEEAYSLAILIHEWMTANHRAVDVKIFATDVHRASLDAANAGVFSAESLAGMSPERRQRYFTPQGDGYRVSQELRKLIVFAQHNVTKDAPFTRLDLVSCRNLLIYLQSSIQQKILSLFHFGLKPGGVLLLGPSESPGEIADEFETIDARWRLYRKNRDVRWPSDLRLPLSMRPAVRLVESTRTTPSTRNDQRLLKAYDTVLDLFMPPSVLITDRREIVHCFGGAGNYLRLPDGRLSNDLLEMVGRDLKVALSGALQRAERRESVVTYTDSASPHGPEPVKVTVRPIPRREGEMAMMLVSFEPQPQLSSEVATPEAVSLDDVSRERVRTLETELRYTRENLQTTVEEMETSNEELQATNEELVASNEELQSTNEELHSVNEELYTVNAEYQRKIAELTELTADMENLLRSTDVGVIFLDRDLRIRKFTPAIGRAFQILPQDVGRRIDGFAYTIDYPALVADVERVRDSETPLEREVRDLQGNCFLLRIIPYRSKSRVEGVVLTLIDVNVLRQAQANLRLMSMVFMDGADPVVIENTSGSIIDLNAEFERAYGWSRDELIGRPSESLLPDDEKTSAGELRARCLDSEHVRNVELERLDKSGHRHPVLVTLSLLTDENGQPSAIASIGKDITALKRSEAERASYAQQLEQTNKDLHQQIAQREAAEAEAHEAVIRRDDFLAMLSHELRTPLMAVINATRIMAHPEVGDERKDEAREALARQARHMARLLDDLLDVARVTKGKIELRRETVDLSRVSAEALTAVQSQFEAKGLQVDIELPDDPLLVQGDPARLQQVESNLLTNAAKFTPRGGQVTLSAQIEGNEAVVRVRDNGAGIEPNMLKRIFDPFVQSHGTRDQADGGLGIGLTLVKRIIELHGGSIEAHSAGPGQGSEFTIRLQAVPPAETPAKPDQQSPQSVNRRQRILLVEDNKDSRDILKALLQLEGYEVTTAADGPSGLESLLTNPPDVALVDIGLPGGFDGLELARRARAAKLDGRTRLVALTGYGQQRDRQRVAQAGFDEHLVKPLRPGDLEKILGDGWHKVGGESSR